MQGMRKILICTIAFVSLCQGFLCCSGSDALRPPPKNNRGLLEDPEALANIKIRHPGQLHNEIMARFYENREPMTGGKLPAPEFAQLLADATNDVLAAHGIEATATVKDVALMLRAFIQMRDEGVMDVFNPTRDGIFNALGYAVRKGIISETASRQYSQALITIEEYDRSPEKDIKQLRSRIVCSTENPIRDEAFMDILDYSYAFWSEIDLEEAMAYAVCDTAAPPDWDPSEKIWLKIASYGTDALWSFLGIAILPMTVGFSIGTVFAATTASLSMECLTGDFMDWLDDQLDEGVD
jgi:hypothetical protein